MNAIVDGKVFRNGNSFAVELPDQVALSLGPDVSIEARGDEVIIRRRKQPKADWRNVSPEEALANNRALAADLRAIWADYDGPRPTAEPRDRDVFPDRPGLY